VIDITFDAEEGPKGLSKALDRICEEACLAARDNYQFLVLSDRTAGASRYLLHFDLFNVSGPSRCRERKFYSFITVTNFKHH
jgi:hypothetical protein